MGSVENLAQFSRSLLNIEDCEQMKYDNEVGDAIHNLKHTVFIYQDMSEEKVEMNKD